MYSDLVCVVEKGLVATQQGQVLMFIAQREAGMTNREGTDLSGLELLKSDEKIFSRTAILTTTVFKSLHYSKKRMVFGKVCYRPAVF